MALYSYVSGTTRTGEYHAADGTPDGFSAGPASVRSSGNTRAAFRGANIIGTQSSTVYEPGGSCTVTCTITYTTKPDSLTWRASTPADWQYASDSSNGTTSQPQSGWTGDVTPLEWVFPKAAIPDSPFSFSFTLNNIPANKSGTKSIESNIVSWLGDTQEDVTVTPSPLNITGPAQTATLTMVVVGNGAVMPVPGTHEVPLNLPQNISATADANWHFANWTLTGGTTVADANDANTTITLTADGTLIAHFVEDGKFQVMVESGTGDGDYHAGDTVSITADAAAPGTEFAGWTSADGVAFADAAALSTTFVMPAKNVTVTANHRITVATLTMVVVGNGAVSPAPGTHEVPLNVPQNIAATADANWHFVNWTLTGGATVAEPDAANTTATLSANGSVSAIFEENPKFQVLVENGSGGGEYYAGATVKITADAAAPGQEFAGWSSDDGAISCQLPRLSI